MEATRLAWSYPNYGWASGQCARNTRKNPDVLKLHLLFCTTCQWKSTSTTTLVSPQLSFTPFLICFRSFPSKPEVIFLKFNSVNSSHHLRQQQASWVALHIQHKLLNTAFSGCHDLAPINNLHIISTDSSMYFPLLLFHTMGFQAKPQFSSIHSSVPLIFPIFKALLYFKVHLKCDFFWDITFHTSDKIICNLRMFLSLFWRHFVIISTLKAGPILYWFLYLSNIQHRY